VRFSVFIVGIGFAIAGVTAMGYDDAVLSCIPTKRHRDQSGSSVAR
jgi:hypothetical protein